MPAPESRDRAASASAELLAQVARMNELARGGEWQRIAELAGTINAMADRWPAGEHGEGLIAARAGIENVMALATAARNELGDRLTAIRHGRKATASYRATGTLRTLG